MIEKRWTKEEIREKLQVNDKWLYRAITVLFSLQTRDEQNCGETKEHNKVGFTGPDAHILSYYAKWLETHKELTGKHKDKARVLVVKYAGQLAKIANKEIRV